MKTLNEYLSLPFKLEIIPDKEEGYVASYPELPGCISCGSTMEDAIRNAEDAKRAWLEAALLDIPNAETLAAFAEVDEMKRTGSGQKFQNLDDLWASLED